MKLVFLLLLSMQVACSSSRHLEISNELKPSSDPVVLFQGCSMIDTTLPEVWVLLCKKSPHLFRSELYEYSPLFKTFKRLTFQDGQISDFVVKSIEDIIYSSTYDESKEQFLAVANGASPGSDLYLKKRNQNDFSRITKDLGSDSDLYWSKETQSLFFSHTNEKSSQIRQLLKNNAVITHTQSEAEELSSPIIVNSTTLFWLSWNKTTQKSTVLTKSINSKASPASLFLSATKLNRIRPSSQPNEILVAFSTGLGTELWSYNFKDICWKPLLQTQTKWSRFTSFDPENLYITENEQIKKVELSKTTGACRPQPTGLGVEVKK